MANRETIVVAALAAGLVVPAIAQETMSDEAVATAVAAQRQRRIAGYVALASGIGMMVGAFNYKQVCDTSRSFYNPNTESKCTVHHAGGGYNEGVSELNVGDFARPWMMYTGAGAATVGALLLTVWSDVPVQVAQDRVLYTVKW